MSPMNVGRVLALCALVSFFAYHVAPDSLPGLSALTGGDRIRTISRGETVDVEKHLSPTGRTIVEFTADW